MSYSALCKRVEDPAQEPDLANALRKSVSSTGAKIKVQLVASCKSHKPPGAKTAQRTIEATPDSVTVTLATSSKTSQPSKHRLNTILCVWTPKSFS